MAFRKKALPGRLIVMGNVPTTLFARGTRAEMGQAICDCIQTAAEGSGYILSSGCEIPLDSTVDGVARFFSYGRKYGREFMAKLREQKPELFQN
jgi:uroporphyrinogen-III decarboxylase